MPSRLISPDRRSRFIRHAAWSCLVLIAYLSLVPRALEMRTPAPPGIEHALAYAVTAGLFVLAYPARPLLLVVGSLSMFSGFMEVLQHVSPGRHPGLDGMLWSGTGAILGSLATAWLQARIR